MKILLDNRDSNSPRPASNQKVFSIKYFRSVAGGVLRKTLLPFSLLYGLITWLRNRLYDAGIFKSKSYSIPVICVGNLNTGGTGKSPMIEYLLGLLGNDYRVASLSRGYKRKTKGYYLLEGTEAAVEVGDEPLQFKIKYPKTFVAVDANRQRGIENLLNKKPEVILLDDAFQHRKVKAGLNILLSSYSNIYAKDFMLPTGNLREPRNGADRAKIVVITKCPPNLTLPERERIRRKLRLRNYQQLFFSFIKYADKVISTSGKLTLESWKKNEFCLVTGIANPQPLVDFLENKALKFRHHKFPDHHNFSNKEISELKKEKQVLTTEKDYMRLKDRLGDTSLFYLPIETAFLENEAGFRKVITDFIVRK